MEYSVIATYFKAYRHPPPNPILILRDLSNLLRAEIPLSQCLVILEHNQLNPYTRLVIRRLNRNINAGTSLANSMRAHPTIFTTLQCNIIQIGEHTGKLNAMLNLLLQHIEQSTQFKQNIRQALAYPCFLFISALIILSGLFLFVIPQFELLFKDQSIKLPLFTQWLFTSSQFINQYVWLIATIGASILLTGLCPLQVLKNYRQRLKQLTYQKIYPFKHYYLLMLIIQFNRQLSICCEAGIPILNAFALLVPEFKVTPLRYELTQMHHHLHSGNPLNFALKQLPRLPPLMYSMVKIGEETGNLPSLLTQLSTILADELEQKIRRITLFIQPALISILGIIIGGLMIALYLPIFNLGHAL